MELELSLGLFYLLLLGFAILMYVLLDGFDLGIGILYPGLIQTQNTTI